MHVNLDHIKTGDKLALRSRNSRYSGLGASHILLVVQRTTATTLCCQAADGIGNREWKFRKADGKEIGQDYSHAEIATPELVASISAQLAIQARDLAARTALADLEGKHFHQLQLTLEQKEALAAAWTQVKAMAAETDGGIRPA